MEISDFSNSIHNVHIRNEGGSDVAYISYYTKGMRILDMTTPLSPKELAYYDTPGVGNYKYPVYDGSWGVYPYFSSGTIVTSDVSGLYVFRKRGEFAGTIDVNTVWSGQIHVTGDVVVAGVSLTIEPGTVVDFDPGTSLNINGVIYASGTSSQPITFRSAAATPSAGDWDGIYFSTGQGGTLENVHILHTTRAIRVINGATPTIKDSQISQFSEWAIHLNPGSPTITGNQIFNTGPDAGGIYCAGSSTAPNINNNTLQYTTIGIDVTNSAHPSITYNSINTTPDAYELTGFT